MMPCIGLPWESGQCDNFAPTGQARCEGCTATYLYLRSRHAAKPPARERGLDASYWRNRRIVMRYARRCAICGNPPTEDDPLECGHKISRSEWLRRTGSYDGVNALSNLQPEHRSCNHAKGSK